MLPFSLRAQVRLTGETMWRLRELQNNVTGGKDVPHAYLGCGAAFLRTLAGRFGAAELAPIRDDFPHLVSYIREKAAGNALCFHYPFQHTAVTELLAYFPERPTEDSEDPIGG